MVWIVGDVKDHLLPNTLALAGTPIQPGLTALIVKNFFTNLNLLSFSLQQ